MSLSTERLADWMAAELDALTVDGEGVFTAGSVSLTRRDAGVAASFHLETEAGERFEVQVVRVRERRSAIREVKTA